MGGRRRDRKRHNRQIAALHAPHIEEEFSHTWTHKETLTHTHKLTCQRGRTKCLYSVGAKHNTL